MWGPGLELPGLGLGGYGLDYITVNYTKAYNLFWVKPLWAEVIVVIC